MSRRKMTPEEKFPDVVHDLRIKRSYFDQAYEIDPNSGCWLWNRGLHVQGYGMMGAFRLADEKSIMATAHRISWRIYHGPITNPNIMHTCNNMNCVNPAHLMTGNQKDVIHAIIARGRMPGGPRGPYPERPWRKRFPKGAYKKREGFNYKYTDEEIQFMRKSTLTEIQERFGFSRDKARHIRHNCRYGYRWLPLPPELTIEGEDLKIKVVERNKK